MLETETRLLRDIGYSIRWFTKEVKLLSGYMPRLLL